MLCPVNFGSLGQKPTFAGNPTPFVHRAVKSAERQLKPKNLRGTRPAQ
jgi:hypothetical protein